MFHFQIIQEAYDDFQQDLNQSEGREKQDDMHRFFNTPPNVRRGTTAYIAKAVIRTLLDGDIRAVSEDMCCVMWTWSLLAVYFAVYPFFQFLWPCFESYR